MSGPDVTLASNCTIPAGTYNLSNFTVNSGVTVTFASNTGAGTGVVINVTGDITINGTLSGNGQGYAAGQGAGAGSGSAAGGHGGNGGSSGGNAYGNATAPMTLGSGGGGGAGGGAIKLYAPNGTITVASGASITANGNNGPYCGGAGAGAGGSIWLEGDVLAGSGLVYATGGDGYSGCGGGGGAGGRIALVAYSSTMTTVSGFSRNARGGTGGEAGGAGTIFRNASDFEYGALTIYNSNRSGAYTNQSGNLVQQYDYVAVTASGKYQIPSGYTLTITPGRTLAFSANQPLINVNAGGTLNLPSATFEFSGADVSLGGTLGVVTDLTINDTFWLGDATFSAGLTDLTLKNGAYLQLYTDNQLSLDNFTMESGSTMTTGTNSSSRLYAIDVSADVIDVQAGATIDVDARGYAKNEGYSTYSALDNRGGGHGGNGGNSGTFTYGNVSTPTTMGAGGGGDYAGQGGGAVKLAATTSIAMNGTITADGSGGYAFGSAGSGGGAGGSVWLQAPSLTGSGSISAIGAAGYQGSSGGGGGGGRIALVSTGGSVPSFSSVNARGGSGTSPNSGGAGTIFRKGTGNTYGDLTVSNAGISGGGYTTSTSSDTVQVYDSVAIASGANYRLLSGHSLTVDSGGTFTDSGSPRPSLTINSGGTFNPPSSTFAFTDLDVTHSGSLGIVQDLSLTNSTYNWNSGSFTAGLDDLTLNSGVVLSQNTDNTLSMTGDLVMNSGAELTHGENSTARSYVVDVSAANITVGSGSTVDADYLGYDEEQGPGAYSAADDRGGGHGGYGGNGGTFVYGNVSAPINLGAGGGGAPCGGRGGGAIKLIASGTLDMSGIITADGSPGTCFLNGGGGGAGGSVWLEAASLTGSGSVTANGAQGYQGSDSGGGSGGRVAVISTSGAVPGYSLYARGGSGDSIFSGSAGTIYKKSSSQTYGDLIVENGSADDGYITPPASANETYDSVTVSNYGRYTIPSGYSLTLAPGGALTGSGTAPTLTVDSGGTLNLTESEATGSLNLTNNGALGLNDTLDVSGTFIVDGTVNGNLETMTVKNGGNFIWRTDDQLFSGSELIVESGGTFTQDNTETLVVTTVHVQDGGTITHADNSSSKLAEVNISATNMTVDSGGTVTATGLGFDASTGDGAGGDGTAGGGAGHGDTGGSGYTAGSPLSNGGSAYGVASAPETMGSGGGNDGGSLGGSGGGVIKLTVTGTLTLNGTLVADGSAGTADEAGGGAGGSIWLDNIGILAGTTGTISANGGLGSGDDTDGGGCGAGGRVRIYYTSKTWGGTPTASSGCTGDRSANPGTISDFKNAPTVTGISFTPSVPGEYQTFLVEVDSEFSGGIRKTELYLDGTDPEDLFHTCNTPADPLSTTCSYSMGPLARGSYTITALAYSPSLAYSSSSAVLTVSAITTSNTVTLSRYQASATEVDFELSFYLNGSSTGTLTVELPDFTVTDDTGSGSSACLSGISAPDSDTITATKTDCSGTVTLTGIQLTNPGTVGGYTITWSNDNGSATVYITDDDQVSVTGNIDPTLTFDLDVSVIDADSDDPYAVDLGTLSTSGPSGSDNGTIPSIWIDLSTNASAARPSR
jgi:hypothetical protein